MTFDLRIDIEEQQPFETDLSVKRVSKNCLKMTKKIHIGRLYLIAIGLMVIIIPLLYLIPCSNAQLQTTINENATYQTFTVNGFSTISGQFSNTTIDDNIDWYIQSVEFGFNPFVYSVNNQVIIQHLIYNQSIDGLGTNAQRLNSLVISAYKSTGDYLYDRIYNNSYYGLNGFDTVYTIPTDYVLSYLKITIVGYGTTKFSVDFYHFFYEDSQTSIKYGMTTQVTINALTFNATSYVNWFNWRYLNSTIIPSDYPYGINVSIRRYNLVTQLFGVYSA